MDTQNIDYSQLTTQNICLLIDNTLSGDNQKIAESTKLLKAYTKHKSSIKTLTYILVNSEKNVYRQMATVLLKRNLVNLYLALGADQQREFRELLLTQYVRESSIAIQRGIATLVGILLPVVELKNWVELQKLIDAAVQSAPDSIATFVLLNCLLAHFEPPKQLYVYLFNALKVPNLTDEVLKCLQAVAETRDIDQNLAVQLIKVWQSAGWHQETSINCLDILNTMAERKIKMNEQIIQWVCNNVIVNKKLSTKFRVLGLDFLTTYAEFNSKSLGSKEKLLKRVIETICQVCSEPFGQQQLQQGQPVQQIALWLIQTLAIALKSKRIYPILLQASTNLINSEDIHQNNTGFLLLGSMAQGCAQRLKKNLQNPVMNVLIPKGLNNPAPQVRGAAINALSYFSEYLIPDIVEYHSTIIPSMINHINDMSTKVAEKALIAIDVFFDNMTQEEIKSYLPVVIPRLSQVVVSQKSSHVMRNASMSGIGTAIQISGVLFEPYVQNVYNMCTQILKIGASPQNNAIRSQNIQTLAKVCNTFCGKDYTHRQQFYKTYTMPVMQPVYQILVTETDPEMRQACFMFFYLLANAIQGQFSGVFDKIIPQVMKSATLKVIEKNKDKKDFSLDSDSQDEGNAIIQMHSSQFDEKSAAIRALGQLGNACPMKIVPYLQQAYKILDDHHQFFYYLVRLQVANCYVNLIKAFIKSQNNGVLPPYKNGLPVVNRYSQNIDKFFKNTIIPRLIFIMTEDDNVRVVSQAIQSLNQMIRALGPACIDHSIQTLTECIIQLLQSQEAQSDEQEQDHHHVHQNQQDQEEDDTQAYIFQPLCGDLIPTLAEILQGAFLPTLVTIFPYMSKFLDQRENINDNVQMVGCIAQCTKHVPSFFSHFGQQLFQNLSKLSELQDTDLNRNIAFCLAQAIQAAPQTMKNHLQHTLLILKKIYQHKDSHQACKDNALAAICRAIIVFNPPMPYQVFVKNLIQSMPFQGDQQEENVAIRCIMRLSETNPMLIKPYIGKLIKIIENDVKQPKKYKLEGEMLNKVTAYLQILKASN